MILKNFHLLLCFRIRYIESDSGLLVLLMSNRAISYNHGEKAIVAF